MRLTHRILLFTSTMIIVLVGATLVFTAYQAETAARASVRQALGEAQEVWGAYQADRFAKLKLGVRVLGNDSPFKAAVQTGDPQTVYDLLKERGRDLAADFFIATDAGGRVVARSDRAEARREALGADLLVARALEGEESESVWLQRDRLFHAVAVPMQFGADLVGVLVAGYAIDEALANELRKLTHSQVAFLYEGGGELRLAASSFGPAEGALRRALAGIATREGTLELELRGERHAAVLVPLSSAAGDVLGRVLVARSLAEELAGYRRFRSSLVTMGLITMAVALSVAVFAAARMTGPLGQLVALVERARDGSYSGAVEVTRQDEIGLLARAFNRLLVDLRDKEALIGFLRAGHTPAAAVPGRPVADGQSPTVALDELPTAARVGHGILFAERYEILETVGRGGMGVVYRVADRELGEIIALKVLRAEALKADPQLVDRFKQEIRLARKITHRNVLRTFDFGVTQGTPYLTMEYLEGVTLKDLIRRKGAVPLSVGLRIARQICQGLEAAHAEGVIHRDIKPQNMLIVPETGEVKITDFGIARISAIDARELTGTGMVMGTPDYISPEQAQGQAVDFRTDIYSLGIVLFEMFSGRLPFNGVTAMAIVLQQVQTPPPPLRGAGPALPPRLEAIVLRCLEKSPDRRYARVSDLQNELAELG